MGGQHAVVRCGTDCDGAVLRVDSKARIDIAQVNSSPAESATPLNEWRAPTAWMRDDRATSLRTSSIEAGR
jgi:hypothetical protein